PMRAASATVQPCGPPAVRGSNPRHGGRRDGIAITFGRRPCLPQNLYHRSFRAGAFRRIVRTMSDAQALFAVLRPAVDADCVAALERLVNEAPDRRLSRINALGFARAEGLD